MVSCSKYQMGQKLAGGHCPETDWASVIRWWAIVLCLTSFMYFICHHYCCFPFCFCPIKLSLSQHINVTVSIQVYPLHPIWKGGWLGSGGVEVNGCVAFSCLLG